jgi:Methyltransferase domain
VEIKATCLFQSIPTFPSTAHRSLNKNVAPTSLLSYHQSFGFFDDIADDEWRMLQKRVREVYPNTKGDPYLGGDKSKTRFFFTNHYEPDFACRHERRIGQLGDGGKWVCDPHRLAPASIDVDTNSQESKIARQIQRQQQPLTSGPPTPPPCLVYSIGSNGDPSFEASIKRDIGPHCEIHTFDMAEHSAVVSETGAIFHQWGISTVPVTEGGQLYKTLNQTLHELGHIGRPIDIFKIDCERCEVDLHPDFSLPGLDLRQILIELHGVDNGKWDGQKNVFMPQTPDFFKAMYRHGYVIFHKEPNIQWSVGGGAIEYCFLKLHRDFFKDIPQLYQEMMSPPEVPAGGNHGSATN